MRSTRGVVGIDIGSVAISVVEVDSGGQLTRTGYAFHAGDLTACLRQLLQDWPLDRVGAVAQTSSTPAAFVVGALQDATVCHIAAAQWLHPGLRSLIVIGGEQFFLARFDEQGQYLDIKTNSSCAAGTGSFLDQHAKTIGFADSADLARAALAAGTRMPTIASRCAVFAKTDLIHAQQEGYSREAIGNGMCHGLAKSAADTLCCGEPVEAPAIFAGGVAKNQAVSRHLSQLVGTELLSDDRAHLYGALGATRLWLADQERWLGSDRGEGRQAVTALRALVFDTKASQSAAPDTRVWGNNCAPDSQRYAYEPLGTTQGDYPDFDSHEHFEFLPKQVAFDLPVEVDVYEPKLANRSLSAYLGIDIGSTSTKAALLAADGTVLAGFYTRTSGQPLVAAQAIFESIDQLCEQRGSSLEILGAGTTGAGRKFIGAIIGADQALDEISAHAKAAVELDPQVDTIIEIGGQDAKFTTLRNGRVNFAAMNSVCAAGTGSFIEEQARRLSIAVGDYAKLVRGARAPLASDRCTVFMQRDINHLLSEGYTVAEVLATVLHSVRENYLQKVAREGAIGQRVCFQGATAKNRALVAAFEQRLGKTVRVSRYCHLTGALGVAHVLRESGLENSSFRGLGIYRQEIPIRSEMCGLCNNSCKISVAEVDGEVAAYGFLCGRDYDVQRFVSKNRSGFDLLRTRSRITRPSSPEVRHQTTVGLPAALTVGASLPFWQQFFDRLGVRTITSEKLERAVASGKKLASAEFCAPMAAFHAHVAHLAERADYVFVPTQLEAKRSDRDIRRQYCYYSQYAGSLVATMGGAYLEAKCIRPLLEHGLGDFQIRARLYTALRSALDGDLSFTEVASAYSAAERRTREQHSALQQAMTDALEQTDDVKVVLLGRPYAVLSPDMNKRIPSILATCGIKTFFQDMLRYEPEDVQQIEPLLREVHWHFASKILEAAEVVAQTPGLYPVLVTSFKCAPDSCITEYFRRILDRHDKPYLLLELDEHDSSVGYETRIEAAIRSFRGHHQGTGSALPTQTRPVNPHVSTSADGRTIFFPRWDGLVCSLLTTILTREGFSVCLLDESEQTIQRSLQRNTGQCIPLSAIAQGFIEAVEARELDPAQALLWLPDSQQACVIGFYPGFIKGLLEAHGHGFEQAAVYRGDLALLDLSMRAARDSYFAYMFGGMLQRLACRVRPYELTPGATDAALTAGLMLFQDAFAGRLGKHDAVRQVVDNFAAIPQTPRNRPKVAIFGDLYTRDNEVINQDLVRFIEANGGEVIVTPHNELFKLVADTYFSRWLREGRWLSTVVNSSLLGAMKMLERKYLAQFERVVDPIPVRADRRSAAEAAELFAITDRHSGESLDNVIKIVHLWETEPELSLFVQANPAFCCPSLVTEAMSERIEHVTGIPVVTLTYDGTSSPKNHAIIPYLKFPRQRAQQTAAQRSG